MNHFVRNAFGCLTAFVVAIVPLAAQQTTGKIEGTVTDQAGVLIAGAQVSVSGTAFNTLTDQKGYYFLNNVPVGTVSLHIQLIGYQPTEIQGLKVLGGQTITQNVKLPPAPVTVAVVNVIGAENPIVPRDAVASKAIVSGDLISNLPTDDVRN